MSTTIIERPQFVSDRTDLQRFQREVFRVVADIVVQNDNGDRICTLTAKAEIHDNPLISMKSLVLGFVKQWSALYDAMITTCRDKRFGHLSETEITSMEIVHFTGTALFSGLKELNLKLESDSEVSEQLLDMATAMHSLKALQLSYECNPTDEELVKMAA